MMVIAAEGCDLFTHIHLISPYLLLPLIYIFPADVYTSGSGDGSGAGSGAGSGYSPYGHNDGDISFSQPDWEIRPLPTRRPPSGARPDNSNNYNNNNNGRQPKTSAAATWRLSITILLLPLYPIIRSLWCHQWSHSSLHQMLGAFPFVYMLPLRVCVCVCASIL